jgi:hypothetical protein
VVVVPESCLGLKMYFKACLYIVCQNFTAYILFCAKECSSSVIKLPEFASLDKSIARMLRSRATVVLHRSMRCMLENYGKFVPLTCMLGLSGFLDPHPPVITITDGLLSVD